MNKKTIIISSIVAVLAILGIIIGIFLAKGDKNIPDNSILDTLEIDYSKEIKEYAEMFPGITIEELQEAASHKEGINPQTQQAIEIFNSMETDVPNFGDIEVNDPYESEDIVIDIDSMGITFTNESGEIVYSTIPTEDLGKSTDEIKAEIAAMLASLEDGTYKDYSSLIIETDENGEIIVSTVPIDKEYIDEDSSMWEEDEKIIIDPSLIGEYNDPLTSGRANIPEDQQIPGESNIGHFENDNEGEFYNGKLSG